LATIAEVVRRAGVSTSTVSHVLDRTRRVEPAGAALVERAVRVAGLRVPGDLALAAFDDFEWADCFGPRLTTVAQPVREIGRLVASPRESCGCPCRG
jgi:DNA-binding LacI/PurR family transcriptional regulator